MLEVTFVGSGDAFGSGGRRNTSILVRGPGGTVLLDCGPTTPDGLRQLGVDARDIDAVAITHFHGDHVAGLPFLLLDFQWEHPRNRPLRILGPPGIARQVRSLSDLYGYEALDDRRYVLEFQEYAAGQARAAAGFEVLAMPALHHPHTRPHMLRVQNDTRALVFSGDTGWHETLPEKVGDVDLFISECVFWEETLEYHLSHERLRGERERFRCGATVLTHLGSEVLREAGRLEFELSEDGTRIEL